MEIARQGRLRSPPCSAIPASVAVSERGYEGAGKGKEKR